MGLLLAMKAPLLIGDPSGRHLRGSGAHLRLVKILVPEISESVVLDHNAEGQEIP